MATRKQLMAAVKAFGGDIDWHNSSITPTDKYIIIDAPKGFKWSASDCSVLCSSWYCGATAEFYDDVLELINEGLNNA